MCHCCRVVGFKPEKDRGGRWSVMEPLRGTLLCCQIRISLKSTPFLSSLFPIHLPFHFSLAPSPSVSDLLSYHVDVLFPKTKTAVQANQNAALCSIFWDSWWQGCCIFSKMHSFMCSVLKEYFDILGNTFIHFLGDGWLIKSILFFYVFVCYLNMKPERAGGEFSTCKKKN